jgi:D-alanyl-D-alanine carboxypeptidase
MLKNFPHHYHFFSVQSFSYKGITHSNHNRLNSWYEGADGLKTGYIRASGFNLVTSAKRDNRRLIGVVMGGNSPASRDQEMARLLDAAFTRSDKDPIIRHASGPRGKSAAKQVQTASAKPPRAARSASRSQPARAEAAAATSGDEWGVQVGAFSQTSAAHRATEQATKLAPTYLSDATVEVTPHATKKGSMFRARLVGISERKMECVTLTPSELTRATSTASAATNS